MPWTNALIIVAISLTAVWAVMIATLLIVRPRGSALKEAVRLLPDTLRLLKRLAGDSTLPRGVRVRLGLLFAYLAIPERGTGPELLTGWNRWRGSRGCN